MNENTYIEEDEITLKELILKLQEFWRELLRNWLLIGLITLPFAAWFFYDAYTTPTEYKADFIFMINEDKGGGGGGIASLAGQFGFNVGGGGGEHNKDKIISLSRSEKIILPIILDSIEIEGQRDLMGNHLIRLYDLHDNWENSLNEELRNFFFTTSNIDYLNLTENRVLKTCYKIITGTKKTKGLASCTYDEGSGILNIASQSISEELSYELTNKIYTNLSSFYIRQQTEPQEKTYKALKNKADSLNILIRSKEYELANLKDSNKNIFLSKFRLREDRLKRELPAYVSQYATLLQNLENADFILKSKTPFFQIVDKPFFPLSKIEVSNLKSLITGGFIGGFLASLFVLGRKIYRDAMSENL